MDTKSETTLVADELAEIDAELQALEREAGMRSEDFYALWVVDQAKDTFENNAWALLIKAKENLLGLSKNRLHISLCFK